MSSHRSCVKGQTYSMALNRLRLRWLLMKVVETINILSYKNRSISLWSIRHGKLLMKMFYDSRFVTLYGALSNFHVLSVLGEIARLLEKDTLKKSFFFLIMRAPDDNDSLSLWSCVLSIHWNRIFFHTFYRRTDGREASLAVREVLYSRYLYIRVIYIHIKQAKKVSETLDDWESF